MALCLLTQHVSDLCLGKPALRSVPISATVSDALSALKNSGDTFIGVWSCHDVDEDRRCIGKVSVADVICFLSREENLASPSKALGSPLSVLIPKGRGNVRHLDPHASLLEAIELILEEGAQNLVIQIPGRIGFINSRKKVSSKSSLGSTLRNGVEFCWLTQEDILRFLLNSIGLFSPVAALSIESLNIIETKNIFTVNYHDPASNALNLISSSLSTQTSVAVIDCDGSLIGEISPITLAACDESVAAAIATLSAGDLLAYIDCGGPPEDLVNLVKARLEERGLCDMLELMEEFSMDSSSSSDEEFGGLRRHRSFGKYSSRMVRRSEPIVCNRGSSLVAVMIQALTHRSNYVWVIGEDCSLEGIVAFSGILKVFREQFRSLA